MTQPVPIEEDDADADDALDARVAKVVGTLTLFGPQTVGQLHAKTGYEIPLIESVVDRLLLTYRVRYKPHQESRRAPFLAYEINI